MVGLVAWGVVHVAGGISLLVSDTSTGLETLGPNASDSVPAMPGEAAESLLRFHSLNILLGGIAVLGLAIAWWRTRNRWQLDVAVTVAAALDIGLIAFLVIPGVLPASQGLIGPTLVVITVIGVTRIHQAHPDTVAAPAS
jgi:hypothetical protein